MSRVMKLSMYLLVVLLSSSVIIDSAIAKRLSSSSSYSNTNSDDPVEQLLLQQMSGNDLGSPAPIRVVGGASATSATGRRGWRRNKGAVGTATVGGGAGVRATDQPGARSPRADSGAPFNHPTTKGDAGPIDVPRQWLELESVPPAKISARLHGEVVLECEAVGSPPPLIYWLKNGKPLDQIASFDSTEITNSEGSALDTRESLLERRAQGNFMPSDFAMAKVRSKLPLRCIRPEEEGVYSCVADNLKQQVVSTTNVAIEEDDPSLEWKPECEFRLPAFVYHKKSQRKGTKAYIHVAESLHMENMGKDIVLPCRAGGKPKPMVSWTGVSGAPITPDHKFEFHTNGDLIIKNLSWNEMGEYSCVAENLYGYEVASTFVYPLLTEDEVASPQIQNIHQQQNR